MAEAQAIAAYALAHGDQIGPAIDNGGGTAAHRWDGLWVQDFVGRGESAQSTAGRSPGRVLVVIGPGGPRLVRNDFYNTYLGRIGGVEAHVALGAPLEEEHGEGGLGVQRFEGGRLLWSQLSGTRAELARVEPGPGFVGTSGGHFVLDGRRFQHVGANAPGLIYDNAGDAGNDLAKMRANGIEQVRVFLANDRFTTGEMIDRLLTRANECDRLELKLTVAMTGNYRRRFFNPEARADAHFFPAGDGQFLTPFGSLDTFTREWFASRYRDNYLPFVRQVVGALEDHPGIFAWEIGNELQDRFGIEAQDTQTYVRFNRDVAAAIKAIDRNHIVATGMISCTHNQLDAGQREALYGDPNIDYLTVHVYDDRPNELADMAADVALAARLGKPLVIEEVGFSRATGDPAARMGAFFDRAYALPGVDAVMLWGLQFDRDHGNGDHDFGPLELGQIDAFMQLTGARALALGQTNTALI